MSRKRFSEREVIETLMHQGVLIWCYRCKVRFELADKIEREHLCELAIGGDDIPFNCAYSHAACHAEITRGTGATTAGTSVGKAAKDKRIATGKMEVRHSHLDAAHRVAQKTINGIWRQLASRPFPPRGARPMNKRRA